MATLTFDITSVSALVATMMENTHFQYSGSIYRKNNNTDADPQAMTVTSAMGVKIFRERLSNGDTAQQQALDTMTGLKIYAAVCDINDDETTTRAVVHAFATGSRKLRAFALTGANEANNGYTGVGNWYDQAVAQQFWIWDQVQIEVNAGNWTSGNRPKVVGCTLKRTGGLSESQYDADIANLKAATYTTASVAYHMADVCDAGDFHWYAGWNGPGFRMDGKDSGGTEPAGVSSVLGSDGLVDQFRYELQRARQIYDSQLTGGTGAIVSGHYKYTGGSVTTGHGATFAMCYSENGTPHDTEGGHADIDWQARGALYGPETFLRAYNASLLATGNYQVLTDRKTDGQRLGDYELSQYPTGAYPIYTAITLLGTGYTGSQSFSGVGSFTDSISGVLPDCGINLFSLATADHWDLYLTRNAVTTAYLTLDATHTITDNAGNPVALSGDGTYHLILSDSLTIWHIVPNTGGGGKPTWTNYLMTDKQQGTTYASGSIAATGATSYGVIGSLPPGATLNTSTGAFGGTTLTTTGVYPVQFTATNGSGTITSPTVNVTIYTVPSFTADSPPAGVVGTSYFYKIVASGFPTPRYSLNSGTLPTGLTLSSDGTISGTPTSAGTFSSIHVTATNNKFTPVTTPSMSITITGSGGGATVPVFTAADPPDGQVGVAYGTGGAGYQFGANGGGEAPTFAWGAGTIPHGLVLTASGLLSGTPDTESFLPDCTVIATNSAGSTECTPFEIDIFQTGGRGPGASITHAIPSADWAALGYHWVTDSSLTSKGDAGHSSGRFWQIEDVNGNPCMIGRLKSSGKFDIDDVDGNSIAKGTGSWFVNFTHVKALGVFRGSFVGSWKQQGDDPTLGRLDLIYRLYGPDDQGVGSCEAPIGDYSDILTATVICAQPTRLTFTAKSGQLRLLGDTDPVKNRAVELPPKAPEPQQPLSYAGAMAGSATPSGYIVKGVFDPVNSGKNVMLQWSASSSMTSPTTVGTVTIDKWGFATFNVTGLPSPNTRYYLRHVDPASGNFVGDQLSYKTAQDVTGSGTRTIAVTSCMDNPGQGSTPQNAWADILAQNPDEVWHLGDWGYWGQTIDGFKDGPSKDIQKYAKVFGYLPVLRQVLATCLLNVVTISDHELHVNGDDWDNHGTQDPTGSFNCPHSIRQIQAHIPLFPVRNWLDTRAVKKHRAYWFDMGPDVRVIVSDFRTSERNNAADPDDGTQDPVTKSMFGAQQRADLRSAFTTSKAILFVNETSWWVNSGTLRATDKPAAYPSDQNDWTDFFSGTGDYSLDYTAQMLWVGGDRHYIGFNGTRTDVPFPQAISSGMLKNALELQDGETYSGSNDWISFNPLNTIDKFDVSQYVILTVIQDGSGGVTVTVNGRLGSTLRQVSDGTTTINSTAISSATAQFTQFDVGQLIAGDGIVNSKVVIGNDGQPKTVADPTFIESVTDSTHAVLTKKAKATVSGNGAWTIQNDVSQWQFSDYPGGSVTTLDLSPSGEGFGMMAMLPRVVEH